MTNNSVYRLAFQFATCATILMMLVLPIRVMGAALCEGVESEIIINKVVKYRHDSAIIHNSLATQDQKIMLGVNPCGNLNTPDGKGNSSNNTQNQTLSSDGKVISSANPGSVGISYYWPGGVQRRDYSKSNYPLISGSNFLPGWYDSTSQGKKWESWSAGGLVTVANQTNQVWASISEAIGQGASTDAAMVLKSFVVDATSVKSTVWITNKGEPILQVSHVYGPTAGATNKYLFQGLVTVTNISGQTINDVRYRRSMDWDILENMTDAYVETKGTIPPSLNSVPPKLWSFCANGGEDNIDANPYVACDINTKVDYKNSLNVELSGLHGQIGSSFDFQLGNLNCNESASFYIYYGAAESSVSLKNAMGAVGATMYSIGYDPNYTSIAYTFGFKGLSGTAVAPTLPTKVASLPAGSSTVEYDPNGLVLPVFQTYAPPILGDNLIYQAVFQFQKDKQWVGEIKRYSLDPAGAIKADPPLLASQGLRVRAAVNANYSSGGRSIWTVGFDSRCMSGSGLGNGDRNNFHLTNATELEKLLFNCPSSSNASAAIDLINFTRGLNSYLEDNATASAVRVSVLGDTYHSEMVMVGSPNAPWSSDANMFGKSEAYFRYSKGYSVFADSNANRRKQIYVGANDGMLHAFDVDLNERWAFVPPPVLPMLRNMAGDKGVGTFGGGKSNSIFTVDGPITVKDVYFYGDGKWKTVLMGGLGWGGNAYYALDITDPDAPTHLFSFNNDVANKSIDYWDADGKKSTIPYNSSCAAFDFSKLGGAWSRPVIMLLPYKGQDGRDQRWAAVFGGGYAGGASVTGTGSTSSFGAYAFAIDLEPDSGISTDKCIPAATSAVKSTGGHLLIATPINGDVASNIPNGVTAHLSVVTGDGTSIANYYGGIAYFTDLQGTLWKWNLSKTTLGSDNTLMFDLKRLFLAKGTVQNDRMGFNQLGSTMLDSGNGKKVLFNYYGTGDLTRIQRRVSDINNRIYGVTDLDFPLLTKTDKDQIAPSSEFEDVNNNSCSAGKSWWANVSSKSNVSPDVDYQKIVGRASVFNKYVYFTAYQPEALECPKYGRSRVIEITDNCQTGGAGAVVGSGLATSPIIDNKGNIYVGMSNLPPGTKVPSGRDNIAKLTSSAASSSSKIQYKSWREKRAY